MDKAAPFPLREGAAFIFYVVNGIHYEMRRQILFLRNSSTLSTVNRTVPPAAKTIGRVKSPGELPRLRAPHSPMQALRD